MLFLQLSKGKEVNGYSLGSLLVLLANYRGRLSYRHEAVSPKSRKKNVREISPSLMHMFLLLSRIAFSGSAACTC